MCDSSCRKGMCGLFHNQTTTSMTKFITECIIIQSFIDFVLVNNAHKLVEGNVIL